MGLNLRGRAQAPDERDRLNKHALKARRLFSLGGLRSVSSLRFSWAGLRRSMRWSDIVSILSLSYLLLCGKNVVAWETQPMPSSESTTPNDRHHMIAHSRPLYTPKKSKSGMLLAIAEELASRNGFKENPTSLLADDKVGKKNYKKTARRERSSSW